MRLLKTHWDHGLRIREHWRERDAIDAEHAAHAVAVIEHAIKVFGNMQAVVYAAKVSQPQLSRALHGKKALSWEATIRLIDAVEDALKQ